MQISSGEIPADFVVDGSILEGGGQILRIAIASSVITRRSVHITKIRAGRSKPGLSHQHLTGIRLCADIANAKLSDCCIGSQDVCMIPHTIRHGHFEADAKTAGSVSLLLQVAVPILAFAKLDSTMQLRGGTDAQFAPPIDYLREVTFHYFAKMGLCCRLDVCRRGFYPQGGGLVHVDVKALTRPLSAIDLQDAGTITGISGYAFVAGNCPIKFAEEMRKVAVDTCKKLINCEADVKAYKVSPKEALGNVITFMLVAHTSAGCRLGVSGIVERRGPSHNQLVADAVQRLANLLHAKVCCDDQMQDQLILPMALAEGCSTVRTGPLTMHTKTAIYVTELMLKVKFDVSELHDGAVIISCNGVGMQPG